MIFNNENNTLLKLIRKYPNKIWCFVTLSANPNITINFVKEFINKNWDWNVLSFNLSIINETKESFDFVFENQNKNFNWYALSENLNIDFIDKYCDTLPWHWRGVFRNREMNEKFIFKYGERIMSHDISFIFYDLSNMKNYDGFYNISLDFIMKNKDLPWCWSRVFQRSDVDIDFILENIEFINNEYCDCWWALSSNENITLDIIKKYYYLNWDWEGLSYNPNLTINFIEKNIDKPWNWHNISANRSIPFHIIDKFPHKPYDFIILSNRKDLDLDIVYKYKYLDWNWNFISCNQNINYEDYKNYEELIPWKLYFLTENPNMNNKWFMELLQKYSDKINNIYDNNHLNPLMRLNRSNIHYDNVYASNNFNWFSISKQNISIDTIKYIHNLNNNLLCWSKLSSNIYIDEFTIEKNLELPWNWNFISQNPNISISFIERNIDKMNFIDLALNDFGHFYKNEAYSFSLERMKKTQELCNIIKDELIVVSMMPERWIQCVSIKEFKNISRNFLV
jgi:hypothetical protein